MVLCYCQLEAAIEPLLNDSVSIDSAAVCNKQTENSKVINPYCHSSSDDSIPTDTLLQGVPLSTDVQSSKDTINRDTLSDSIQLSDPLNESFRIPMQNNGALGERGSEEVNIKNDSCNNDTLKLIQTYQLSDSISIHTDSVTKDSLPVLDRVVITAKRQQRISAFATTSVTQYDSSEIRRSPGNFGDVSQVLSRHPSSSSITTYNDNSFSIRGGLPSENVFIIDGLELDNVSHFMQIGNNKNGSLGILDTRTIRGMTFYTAGTPVDLASRISSVTDIQLCTGNDSCWSHEIDLGINGVGLMSQGPLPLNGSSYLLLLRYANLKLLDTFLQGTGIPKYGDGLLKISIPIGPSDRLQVLAVGACDKFEENYEYFEKKFYNVNLKNVHSISSSTLAADVSWYRTGKYLRNSLFITGSNQHKDDLRLYTGDDDTALVGFVYEPLTSTPSGPLFLFRGSELTTNSIISYNDIRERFSIAENISVNLNPDWLASAGVFCKLEEFYLRSQWGIQDFHITLDQNEVNAFQSHKELPAHTYHYRGLDNDISLRNVSPGGYLQIATPGTPLSFRTGVRFSRESIIGKNGLTAYAGTTYKFKNSGNLSLGLNCVEQVPSRLNELIFRSLRYYTYSDDYTISIRGFELQRCTQAVIEHDLTIGNSLECSFTGYSKWYDREVALRAPDSPWFDVQFDIDNNCRPKTAIGKKCVTGTECIIKGKIFERIKYQGTASLSVGYDKYVDGEWYQDSNGFFRKVSLSIDCNVWRKNYLTASFDAQSAKKFSRMLYASDSGWYYDHNYQFNSESLDPVFDVSFRYTMHKTIGALGLDIFVDVYNVFNSTPVIEKKLIGSAEYEDLHKNGIIPTIGMRLTF